MSRYRLLIFAFALTALTILLTVASSPTQAAPRSIPWDCSDWQESPAVADADDARVSMILETLAANRGKSIYCAIDQSDTWTKTETWLAGRDRNERDDTVYFGQSGNFRGFLSAQEGYLTDGESGVTGVSRDLIFEFPREERKRRRWKTVTERRVLEPSSANDQMVWSEWGGRTNQTSPGSREEEAQHRFTTYPNNPHFDYNIPNNRYGEHSRLSNWPTLLQEKGNERCQAAGYPRAVNPQMSFVDPSDGTTSWISSKVGETSLGGTGRAWPSNSRWETTLGANLSDSDADGASGDTARLNAENGNRHYAYLKVNDGSNNWYGWARQSFPFSVTCEKKVRKRR